MSNTAAFGRFRACPVKRILLSGLLGVLLTIGLTLGSALLLQQETLPISACRWLGPVIVALSAFISAWLAARRNEKKLLCGLLTACLYGLSLLICGMLAFSAPMVPGRMAVTVGSLLGGTAAGVVLSALGE